MSSHSREEDAAEGGDTANAICAPHHPAYLVAPSGAVVPLKTPRMMVGAMPNVLVKGAHAQVPPDGRLYLFSDGIFEVATNEGPCRLQDFVGLLQQTAIAGASECQRLYASVKALVHPRRFEDDVSLLVVTFP